MGVQTVVIKCPFCNQHLSDTKQEWIICNFCGKKFKRAEIQKAKEEEMRRNMILDLNDQIKKEKTSKKVGYTIGALFFVFAMAMQFLLVFEITEIANYSILQADEKCSIIINSNLKLFDILQDRYMK